MSGLMPGPNLRELERLRLRRQRWLALYRLVKVGVWAAVVALIIVFACAR